ncbi:pentatricopeptide repeat-containing family protein [Tripterygium wilfordii]|uniref:Pentatricopeptide repeat-containing family protein n=1 Tax=Tripterygium wilfordii TaxID=458696 RepID=A0A7J7CWS8_TRIWF|nr:pentatricopeptide repeat-containing protein At1g43980, mitochondrial [Tripterygium wilfordii]KAF5738523.1 pentatricopeptide repeat-containing family protein [Tripterygium wilfordii]
MYFHKTSLYHYTRLIDHCLSVNSWDFAKRLHAQLIKVGFSGHTFVGNRCLDMYSHFGAIGDALKVFDDITQKNIFSWNICLKGLINCGQYRLAQNLFDEMPERDVVGWNSMILGCASYGHSSCALELFSNMQIVGVRPSEFTYSILLSLVNSEYHVKQIHGNMIRRVVGVSNVVLGNSLIDMYGKVGLVDYALVVFLAMDVLDVVSWNSLIVACCKSGDEELAFHQFCLMRYTECLPDEFTISTIITACSSLQNLGKGKQVFALCIKVGFLHNTIVSSATIDLFSKCNKLEDSVQLFEELDQWDSALCNSMISSFERHGLDEEALNLFLLTMRENVRPTEFTLSSILSCVSFLLAEQGGQVHSLVVKLGMESDMIVASSLIEMYSKLGLIGSAMNIFSKMEARDLVSWNTIIIGLSRNGGAFEALDIFTKLLRDGPPPDRITFFGGLLACNYGSLLYEGMMIFSSMEEDYGIIPSNEHCACIVDLLCQAGKLKEALDTVQRMPHEPGSLIWDLILRTCANNRDLKLIESVAERLMHLEPWSLLPYLILARAYEIRGRWEDVVRVRKVMKLKKVNNVTGCSWVVIRNCVYTFKGDRLQLYDGSSIYSVSRLLIWDIEDEGYISSSDEKLGLQK